MTKLRGEELRSGPICMICSFIQENIMMDQIHLQG